MLHISSLHVVHFVYLGLAVVGSLIYGFGAFKLHGVNPPASGWQRWLQYLLNGAGAAVGWLAGWVVLVRWLGCTYVCQGEPTGWTILLAVLAFVGITGFLPLTLMHTIAALKALLAKLSP